MLEWSEARSVAVVGGVQLSMASRGRWALACKRGSVLER